MNPKSTAIFNLDDPELSGATLVLEFNGLRCTVDRSRILQLMQREQEWLKTLTSADAPGAASEARRVPARIDNPDAVNHASLSSRIRKIYLQAVESHRLRPAHADMIADLITQFDWRVPNHPNTRLDTQLSEIASWHGTSTALKESIAAFLIRYSECRRGALRNKQPGGAA